jgi:hypothetical protein
MKKPKKTCTYVQALMALDAVCDVVLAYRPKAKQKAPRERKKSTKKVKPNESTERESST